MQCDAKTVEGKRCLRNCNSEQCWQHKKEAIKAIQEGNLNELKSQVISHLPHDETNTLIDDAAKYNDTDIFNYLLSQGERPDFITLDFALENKSTAIFKILFKMVIKGDPNDDTRSDPYGYVDYYKYIMLIEGPQYDDYKIELMQLLIEEGIYPNNTHLQFIIDNYDYIDNDVILWIMDHQLEPNNDLYSQIALLSANGGDSDVEIVAENMEDI